MSELDAKMRPVAEALLAPGEQRWGVCVATQTGMFKGRQVLLAVTGGRLLVQHLNRRFEPPVGDMIALRDPNGSPTRRSMVPAAGGPMSGWRSWTELP